MINGQSPRRTTPYLRNLVVYEDAELRLAISRAVAVETLRGWKISKATASHKIDVVVALAQACLGAVLASGVSNELSYISVFDLSAGTQTFFGYGDRSADLPTSDPLTWTDPLIVARG